jgi:hypothetical protein
MTIAPPTRQIVLATLWQRESQKGATYFAGFLGSNKLLLFDAGMQDHPTKPGEQVHVWNLILQPNEAAPTRNAERGQQTYHRARHADRSKAQQAGEAILRAFGREGDR